MLPNEWTLEKRLTENHYHIEVIRSQLTRNIASVFSSLHEEVELAFQSSIPATEGMLTIIRHSIILFSEYYLYVWILIVSPRRLVQS